MLAARRTHNVLQVDNLNNSEVIVIGYKIISQVQKKIKGRVHMSVILRLNWKYCVEFFSL